MGLYTNFEKACDFRDLKLRLDRNLPFFLAPTAVIEALEAWTILRSTEAPTLFGLVFSLSNTLIDACIQIKPKF